MYNNEMLESMKKVAAKRAENAALEPRRMTADEKDTLLATYHPDYKQNEFSVLEIGANKGEKVPTELAALLQANSRIKPEDVDLDRIDYDVDVLVIGGGGAGSSAAIEAHNGGANVMIVTKLRIGDANTMMAEGGIQAATSRTILLPYTTLTPSAADILPQSRSCSASWSPRLPMP